MKISDAQTQICWWSYLPAVISVTSNTDPYLEIQFENRGCEKKRAMCKRSRSPVNVRVRAWWASVSLDWIGHLLHQPLRAGLQRLQTSGWAYICQKLHSLWCRFILMAERRGRWNLFACFPDYVLICPRSRSVSQLSGADALMMKTHFVFR